MLPDIVPPVRARLSDECPVKLAVIVPALKFPPLSRATIVEAGVGARRVTGNRDPGRSIVGGPARNQMRAKVNVPRLLPRDTPEIVELRRPAFGSPVALVSVSDDGVPPAPPLTTNAPAVPTLTPRAVPTPVPNPVTLPTAGVIVALETVVSCPAAL